MNIAFMSFRDVSRLCDDQAVHIDTELETLIAYAVDRTSRMSSMIAKFQRHRDAKAIIAYLLPECA